MKIENKLLDLQENTSVALGVFDGVHIGHQAVIGEAVNGRENGLVPVVFTFDLNHERPTHKKGQETLLTPRLKEQKIAELGAELMLNIPFEEVRTLSPEAFVEQILFHRLRAKQVVCGFDFRFGRDAAGDSALLERLGEALGIRVVVVPPMLDRGEPVSSTRIRHYLREGNISAANRLLGYEYCYDMTVVDGLKNGRKMGIPTINQEFAPGYLIPKFGVYASRVLLDGKEYLGMTNIGVKPTIAGNRNPLSETFIIGVDRNLYGQNIRVSLFQYLREERKFSGLAELSTTVKGDIDRVKAMLPK